MFPNDVIQLIRLCKMNDGNSYHRGAIQKDDHDGIGTQGMMSPIIVVDNPRSPQLSRTLQTLQHQQVPPLRPYIKSNGGSSRKRMIQHQRMMDRWTASDGQQQQLHNQCNRQKPSTVSLSPMKPIDGRDIRNYYSPSFNSSPACSDTSSLRSLLTGSASSTGTTNAVMKKMIVDSPPIDSSPRLVRRLPSNDGMDFDFELPVPKPSTETLSENNRRTNVRKATRRQYAPRRPTRQDSILDDFNDSDSDDDDNNCNIKGIQEVNITGNNCGTTPYYQRAMRKADLSPRKPARRTLTRDFAMESISKSPKSSSSSSLTDVTTASTLTAPTASSSFSTLMTDLPFSIDSDSEELTFSAIPSNRHFVRNKSNYCSTPSTNFAITNSATTRAASPDGQQAHGDNNETIGTSKSSRTAQYIMEALTIVNLCDIEHRSSFSKINRMNQLNIVQDDTDLENNKTTSDNGSATIVDMSSDESTVESIPSINSSCNITTTDDEAIVKLPPSPTLYLSSGSSN